MSANDGNPKTTFGNAKVPLDLVPAPATAEIAKALQLGGITKGYGPYNWRHDAVSASTYIAAAKRHIDEWAEGRELDPESGAHVLGHAAASLCILIDAQLYGSLIDNRPANNKRFLVWREAQLAKKPTA